MDNNDAVDNGDNGDNVGNGDDVDNADDDNHNRYIADNKLVEIVYPFLFPLSLKLLKPIYVSINKRAIGQLSILK
ncbi:hypothetical protein [Ectobacillus panaciterrae]|uniref:hypothetical protein n=1 Tax=Ectobacillus panaciterrae TaxID=363872 RepID=UPI00048E7042|nr:hypothetical protein [Ectobacillus panaciterrae]